MCFSMGWDTVFYNDLIGLLQDSFDDKFIQSCLDCHAVERQDLSLLTLGQAIKLNKLMKVMRHMNGLMV